MRFNSRITFIYVEDEYYDPTKGEYVESDPIETIKACNISTMGLTRQKEVFGAIDKHVTIARLQHPYTEKFTRISLNGKKYKVMQESNYKKGVLFLEGGTFE